MLTCEKTGLIDYSDWQKLQQEYISRRKEHLQPDTLYCLEHPAVFTIGRAADIKTDILVPHETNSTHLKKIPLVKSERGGGMMFHNPGQIVAYPIILLRGPFRNLRTLTWLMEETIIRTLEAYNVIGFRKPDFQPGVWTEFGKIGFIGIAVRHQVTFHGCATNIINDLEPFRFIAPCGLQHEKITSIRESTGNNPDLDECKNTFCTNFYAIYNYIKNYDYAYRLSIIRQNGRC